MKRNNDGTPISAETAAEIIAQRSRESMFPYLSDLLGDDWGTQMRPGEDFWQAAYRIARAIYPDEAGHLCVRVGHKWC